MAVLARIVSKYQNPISHARNRVTLDATNIGSLIGSVRCDFAFITVVAEVQVVVTRTPSVRTTVEASS
jgi:hypothetical protein